MIERIIDKYYLKKLKQYIQEYSLKWYLDTKFIDKKAYIEFQVKIPKYKDKEFKSIYSFYKNSALYYLLNMEGLNKKIDESVKKYLESEGE